MKNDGGHRTDKGKRSEKKEVERRMEESGWRQDGGGWRQEGGCRKDEWVREEEGGASRQ